MNNLELSIAEIKKVIMNLYFHNGRTKCYGKFCDKDDICFHTFDNMYNLKTVPHYYECDLLKLGIIQHSYRNDSFDSFETLISCFHYKLNRNKLNYYYKILCKKEHHEKTQMWSYDKQKLSRYKSFISKF